MSKSTSRNFRLFFSAVIRECAFAVKIWFYFIQFILSLFFPNRLTFVGNLLIDVGFKIGVRNFKIVITKDNADLASKSANSFPRILLWLGSQQNIISFETER